MLWLGSLSGCWTGQDYAAPFPPHLALLSALGDLVSAEAASASASPAPTHHAAKQCRGQGQGKGRALPHHTIACPVPRELVT